jgi:hypothetical protein
MEVSGQLRATAVLPPGKEPLVPIGFHKKWRISLTTEQLSTFQEWLCITQNVLFQNA